MTRYKRPTENTSGSGSQFQTLALFIILLSFFIVLNSISTFEDEKNDYLKFQQRGDDTERFIGKRESKKENECEIGVNSLDLDWLVEEPPPLSMSMSKELKLKSYNGRKQHQEQEQEHGQELNIFDDDLDMKMDTEKGRVRGEEEVEVDMGGFGGDDY